MYAFACVHNHCVKCAKTTKGARIQELLGPGIFFLLISMFSSFIAFRYLFDTTCKIVHCKQKLPFTAQVVCKLIFMWLQMLISLEKLSRSCFSLVFSIQVCILFQLLAYPFCSFFLLSQPSFNPNPNLN